MTHKPEVFRKTPTRYLIACTIFAKVMMTEKMHFLRQVISIVWKLIIFPQKIEYWKIFWKIFLGQTYCIFMICEVLKIKFEQLTCNLILFLSMFPFLFSFLSPPLHFIDYVIIERARVKCVKYWSTEGNTAHLTSFKKATRPSFSSV